MIADETRMGRRARTTTNGCAPQMSHEDRKPDPVAVEAKNAADPDQVAHTIVVDIDNVNRRLGHELDCVACDKPNPSSHSGWRNDDQSPVCWG